MSTLKPFSRAPAARQCGRCAAAPRPAPPNAGARMDEGPAEHWPGTGCRGTMFARRRALAPAAKDGRRLVAISAQAQAQGPVATAGTRVVPRAVGGLYQREVFIFHGRIALAISPVYVLRRLFKVRLHGARRRQSKPSEAVAPRSRPEARQRHATHDVPLHRFRPPVCPPSAPPSSATSWNVTCAANCPMRTSAPCACKTAGTSSVMRPCCVAIAYGANCTPANFARWLTSPASSTGVRPLHHPNNWIPLVRAADVMDLLAENMRASRPQATASANIAATSSPASPLTRWWTPPPYAEVLRQWSTLPLSSPAAQVQIAIHGAAEDRAAIGWHDVGLQLLRDEAGEVGFRVLVGGGMGRTPVIASEINAFVPGSRSWFYLEAIVRVYKPLRPPRQPRLKARIKILVKAEGQKFLRRGERRVPGHPEPGRGRRQAPSRRPSSTAWPSTSAIRKASWEGPATTRLSCRASTRRGLCRWLARNVHGHRVPGYAPSPSLKRLGLPPGDATDADGPSRRAGRAVPRCRTARQPRPEPRALPWVRKSDPPAVFLAAKAAGFATPNINLLTDAIACPGGDFCALANARSIPVAEQITERFQDVEELRKPWAPSTCTSQAASTPADTTTAVTSASWASTRTAPSGTSSPWAALTAPRSRAQPPQAR